VNLSSGEAEKIGGAPELGQFRLVFKVVLETAKL
jgi:hypothetical protein